MLILESNLLERDEMDEKRNKFNTWEVSDTDTFSMNYRLTFIRSSPYMFLSLPYCKKSQFLTWHLA